MSKIADVVSLKTGYANFVELKSAFEETQENLDRMAMYRPTTAHRKAFERLCRGVYQPNDKKFYLLSGSYGTGKSHLCLMFANFLSRASGDPAMKGFYENYGRLDRESAKTLKNVRKDGQYLIAICDFHSGKHFEDVVMRAVFEACESKELEVGVQSQFSEAERLLANWEKESAEKEGGGGIDFYNEFGRVLGRTAPGVSVDQIRANLAKYDSDSLAQFAATFREVVGGLEFQPQSGNLIDILKEILRSTEFKSRFKGLAIFFDEFGFTLEKSAYSKDVLQGFMEILCQNEPNVIFVGCIHKDFRSYADRYSRQDLAVMNARITQVDLLNEGIEEIICAIVETHKDSEIWINEIQPKTAVFDQLVPICKTLELFPWIQDMERIRQRVLEDIYGVHPMALACLLKLSSEVGSDARSTFTFFSGDVGEEAGSYPKFIQSADITLGDGRLNLYRADGLYEFFEKDLSLRNTDLRESHRRLIDGFGASLEALHKLKPVSYTHLTLPTN